MITEKEWERLKRRDRALLYMFIFTTFVFTILALSINSNQNRITRTQNNQSIYNWEKCETSVVNTTKLNEKDEALIRLLVKFGKPHTPAIDQWIQDTRAAHLTVPECGPRP